MKAGANIHGQLSELRLQLLRESVFVAAFDGKLQCQQSVKDGAAELREHARPSRQPGPPEGSLRAASSS